MRLAELQAAFGQGLAGSDMPPELVALVRGGPIAPAARLGIHRNHVRTSLTEALALHFPVVRRLVGEEAFAVLALRFIAVAPPTDPRLALFGAGFAEFLAGEPGLAAYPAVAEVAGFEWARHRAALAERAPALEAAHLGSLSPEALEDLALGLLPGLGLVAAGHAVDEIWAANQPPRDGTPEGDVAVPCRLAVWRDGEGLIRAAALSPAEFALLQAVGRGLALGPAVAEALAAEPAADLSDVLARVLGRGLLCLSADLAATGETP
ncbi:putative DNA-binding domain-containing protein [Zavarzinia sp.]|uniref:HvfC/BufC family peptide modification chaperone n=1 Tax=Zavarzinia sp. TaxID=2027920 RepID=UPI00356686DE